MKKPFLQCLKQKSGEMFFVKIIETRPVGVCGLPEEGLLPLIYRVTWLARII